MITCLKCVAAMLQARGDQPVRAVVVQVDEVGDKRRGRLLDDRLRRADLLDLAMVHHHHAVGHFQRFFLVMRDKNAGDVQFVMQAAQPLAQFLAHLGVQRAEGFIEQQHARFDSQRTRQRQLRKLDPIADAGG